MKDINNIYNLLADKKFQKPGSSNLFFPVYVYTYPPENEYIIRNEINILIEKLERPDNYLETKVLNVYHELIDFLKNEELVNIPIFEHLLTKEKENPAEAFDWIREIVDEGKLFKYIEDKIKTHYSSDPENKAFLIIHGFGSIYPYLRASEFIKNTESLVKDFKIIIFYPGEYKNSKYSLFKILNDDNMYRANYLNNMINKEINS